ncbi:hypothetical protein CR513_50734, partial [Mucuna pruriens]
SKTELVRLCRVCLSWNHIGSSSQSSTEINLTTKNPLISLVGEDPHKHLKEFHVIYSTMRQQEIPEDYIKMKAFPFSLDGAAKDWLYLQPVLFNT